MRRNRKQATGLAVSLFPFLAVLICTMGVLIVMLVLAVKSSSVKAQEAKQEHADDVNQRRDVLLDQLDLEQFRVEKITEMRPEIQKRLEQEKLRRSHLDNEIRKLVQDVNTLARQFQQLELDGTLAIESGASETAIIDELKLLIIDRRDELKQLRKSVAGRPVMYSIVPTRSSGGTGRRPIYVECSPTGITLQPAGLQISLDEFTRPILPGNPLDAALLATREYWNKFEAGSNAGEPYPLIVVRPGGATAYAIARRAMTSWDDEFGYELVESTKQLNWGDRDANLAKTLRQAIQIAKRRQMNHVAAGRAMWMNTGVGRMMPGNGGQTFDGSNRGRNGLDSQGGRQTGQSSFGADRDASNATADGFTGAANAGFGNPVGDQRNTGIDTTKQDSLSRFASDDHRSRKNVDSRGNPLRPGQGDTTSTAKQGAEGGAFATDPAAFSRNATGNVTGNASANATVNEMAHTTNTQPLSSERGANWALPTRTPGATPYRRPIRVDCHHNHYLVHSGDPARQPVRVEIKQTVDVAIDELVNQIWNQIESWGMAEIGGYWKPVLRLSVNNAIGAGRADELTRKLEGSGIEIERLWR